MNLIGKTKVVWEDKFLPHDRKASFINNNFSFTWSGVLIGYRKNIWGRIIALIARRDGLIVEEPITKLRVHNNEEVCLTCVGSGYTKGHNVMGGLAICDKCHGEGYLQPLKSFMESLKETAINGNGSH